MYVCVCSAVTESDVNQAIDNGADTVQQLKDELNVSICCGSCECTIEEMLEEKSSSYLNNVVQLRA